MKKWLTSLPAHLKAVLVGGIVFVIASLIPPWKQESTYKSLAALNAGYRFIFWPPKPNRWAWESFNPEVRTISVQIDSTRLFIEWAIVIGATLTAFILLRNSSSARAQ
jgi:hypothetical protein